MYVHDFHNFLAHAFFLGPPLVSTLGNPRGPHRQGYRLSVRWLVQNRFELLHQMRMLNAGASSHFHCAKGNKKFELLRIEICTSRVIVGVSQNIVSVSRRAIFLLYDTHPYSRLGMCGWRLPSTLEQDWRRRSHDLDGWILHLYTTFPFT